MKLPQKRGSPKDLIRFKTEIEWQPLLLASLVLPKSTTYTYKNLTSFFPLFFTGDSKCGKGEGKTTATIISSNEGVFLRPTHFRGSEMIK